MDYKTCLQRCISIRQAEGGKDAEADIAAYRAFPSPSDAEWAEVLRDVAAYDDSDEDNPFEYMARY